MRFHNVVASLMLSKPTVAISYGAKHESLMGDSGLAEYCTPVKSLDSEHLAALLTKLGDRAPDIQEMLTKRNAASRLLLAEQFARISHLLITARPRRPGRPSFSAGGRG